MAPPAVVGELVERFDSHADAYRSGEYNEAQLREEFLNPFFDALGWDVYNKKGYAEAYKEVIHEAAIKVGGRTKAPDYCFRAGGGVRSFFVEAKKPSVRIHDAVSPAYQLRRYAWSAKLPVSILTDFEEWAVYDCRIRPVQTDRASTARVMYHTYDQYPECWDELEALFSPEAIRRGALDKFVTSKRVKKGTAEVDDAFLDDIESWREMLARNIALRNPELSQRDLNFAVQRTIDRIVFLRICEDRGIEPYGTLRSLQNGPNVYPRLAERFQRADERYNSGLFHFTPEKGRTDPPDELTLGLAIDDKPLKAIIGDLYYPDSPYEFSVLPAEILGHVYEQFLGKVIRLTAGHRAVVEDKPEVKKAGGVYYTPTYIVDYIVEHTVGKLLEGKKPAQAAKLTILDPACGSGSFLLGAYKYLLDWHQRAYFEDDPEKHARGRAPRLCRGRSGDWRLTTAERKRILLNNLYGVDVDPQAVEVTKLSLLLKVLEGESQQTLSNQLRLFHERALPDLASNIKCGNSLIGPDFYEGRQISLLDEEEAYRINAFDWEAEFPEVFEGKNGGFDAVIGNPPYIRVRIFRDIHPEQIGYLTSRYDTATHVWDIYLLFFEKAQNLTRRGGRFAFIAPIQTLHQPNCESLRHLLLERSSLCAVADLSRLRVFRGPIVKNCILVCERAELGDRRIDVFFPAAPADLSGPPDWTWPHRAARENPGYSLKLDLLSPKKDLCEKLLARSWELGELCYVTFGLRSCAKGKGQGGKDRLIVETPEDPRAKLYLEGRDIQRYAMHATGRYIKYIPDEMYSPRTPELFEQPKIVSQTMLSRMRLIATLDRESHYPEQSLLCVVRHGSLTPKADVDWVPLEFILGVVNSRVASFYFATRIIDYSLGGGLVHATPGSQSKLPVPRIDEGDEQEVVSAVQRILSCHERLATAKTAHDIRVVQRQIDATDREIDRLVYELYGLSEEEIAIVEGTTQTSSA